MGGKWDETSLPIRPDLYLNFKDAALANIEGGARGIVGIPIFTYTTGTATAGKFYTVEDETEAKALVGDANVTPIKRILEGGAKQVLIYTVPTGETVDYPEILDAFEAEEFNVFVYPTSVASTVQTTTKSWVSRNRDEGKHFFYVTGGTKADDATPATGNTRSTTLKDEYIVNLITGVFLADGTEVASADFAPYIAGLIAGTPINQSITFNELPLVDVTKRLKNSEIVTALTSGSLVIRKDGNRVIIEQGITTDSNAQERGKIRVTSAKQAVATDIPAAARANYIGKVDNNPAGQAALITAIKRYLETLENSNVLMSPTVDLDNKRPSTGDTVFVNIAYTEVDSMERIFVTVTV